MWFQLRKTHLTNNNCHLESLRTWVLSSFIMTSQRIEVTRWCKQWIATDFDLLFSQSYYVKYLKLNYFVCESMNGIRIWWVNVSFHKTILFENLLRVKVSASFIIAYLLALRPIVLAFIKMIIIHILIIRFPCNNVMWPFNLLSGSSKVKRKRVDSYFMYIHLVIWFSCLSTLKLARQNSIDCVSFGGGCYISDLWLFGVRILFVIPEYFGGCSEITSLLCMFLYLPLSFVFVCQQES